MIKYLYVTFFLLVSCSSVDNSKFGSFQRTVTDLTGASEKALLNIKNSSREAGIQRLSLGKESKPSELKLRVLDYKWEMDAEPTYLKIHRAQVQLANLNHLFLSYAELLSTIAGSEIEDSKTFSVMATELNKNANEVLSHSGVNIENKTTGLLSSIAVASFETFIDKKRHKFLKEAIRDNQEYVTSYISHIVALLDLIKQLKVKIYNDQYTLLAVGWVKSSNKDGSARGLYQLNDNMINELEELEALKNSFEMLPSLHKDLIKSSKSTMQIKAKAIENSLKRVQELQKSLKE